VPFLGYPSPSSGGQGEACAREGFDLGLSLDSARLCGMAYHSASAQKPSERAEVTKRIERELVEHSLELVAEVHDDVTDGYALIVQNASDVFVVFRGSCSIKNLQTDLDYKPDAAAMRTFAAEASLPLPDEAYVHRGFLEAWRALRAPVLAHVEALLSRRVLETPAGPPPKLGLHVTGHSMGGAIALLASLEFAQLSRRRRHPPFAAHTTYTFAAPRLGNREFASFFSRCFPAAEQHWALQGASDAVPHLPFAAWGFQHPRGVLKLGRASPRRSGDPGDHVDFLRPKEGKLANWVASHDLRAYLSELSQLTGVAAPAQPWVGTELPAAIPRELLGLAP